MWCRGAGMRASGALGSARGLARASCAMAALGWPVLACPYRIEAHLLLPHLILQCRDLSQGGTGVGHA